MTPARLADACVAALGPVGGPVAILAPDAPAIAAAVSARVPRGAADGARAAVVVFTHESGDPTARLAALRALHAALPAGAPVVLVDHNRPRSWWGRLWAAAVTGARGVSPSRVRHPAARELQSAGFPVETLRLLARERLQLVRARRGD